MNQPLNPDDFVITRKRKKYKFAKFYNATNCFEFDEWQPRAVDVLEIGAGTGLFSVELAERHPELQFVALDVKADRLQKGAYEALEHGLENVQFVRARADQITDLFAARSLDQIWLNFADPFPRDRSARRRMTHPLYLERYATLLRPSGVLLIKHDDPAFFAWSLEQLVAENWHIEALSFDVHQSDLDDDYKIMTSYEQRWILEGRQARFVKARRGVVG